MAQHDPLKWYMPGWRVEQRYSPGVLIGNWSEERHTFDKGNYKHNSSHRIDFRDWNDVSQPDSTIRRAGELLNEGKGDQILLKHHGNAYMNNRITWYDENYNGRWKEKKLPPLREYHGHYMAWVPERNDYPLQGPSTNFGLLQAKQKQWEALEHADKVHFKTIYQASYIKPPFETLVRRRCAIPRMNSSTLHPFNHINENMILRSNPTQTVKAPETLTIPQDMTPVSI